MSVAIVIVNFRTAALVVDCLESIVSQGPEEPPLTVVVDNDSPDDSVEVIQSAIEDRGWGAWARVIAADRNGGFAFGNNVGIRVAMRERPNLRYVHLLNPDTVVRPGAVRALVEFIERHPDVGIVGSRLEDPDATPQRSAFRFPSVLGELESAVRIGLFTRLVRRSVIAPPVEEVAHQTDWVAGASMLIRREVFENIGMLDERYFMYYEEVEFCRRAAQAGWACWYVPDSRVVHLVGQASGIVQGNPKRLPRYWFESRRRYFVSQHGWVSGIVADLAWFVGTPARWAWSMIRSRHDPNPSRFLRDLAAHGAARRGVGP